MLACREGGEPGRGGPGGLGKYDCLAERFTAHEYADPGRYFARRARLVLELGPRLAPGDTVLDLACADGSFAEAVLAAGLRYIGVDASGPMVEVARRRLGGRARIELGDLNTYRPPAPVAATTCFRSLQFARDRRAFFRHVAEFTERKLVFDLAPRTTDVDGVRRELLGAGFAHVALRPFFVPQRHALPAPLAAGLALAERAGPLARLVLRFRFACLCAAWR